MMMVMMMVMMVPGPLLLLLLLLLLLGWLDQDDLGSEAGLHLERAVRELKRELLDIKYSQQRTKSTKT